MNKARRQELKKLKYLKRLRKYGLLNEQSRVSPKGERYNYTGYMNHGAPCSCCVCSNLKYRNIRAKIKRSEMPKEKYLEYKTMYKNDIL